MKFIDLFAGIGGFHYGLNFCDRNGKTEERNGETNSSIQSVQKRNESISSKRNTTITNGRQKKFHCVYSNEWDKYANSVYRKHFGECDSTDITKVSAKSIPDHDLLCGGFPCQSFSIAGKRGGFNDTRGTLFFDIARILKEKQPRRLLLENVKGLLSHDEGRTFKTIIATLVELGYDCQWQVLNSKNFGVPQNRERVFIIGHLRGGSRPEIFPISEIGDISKSGQRETRQEIATALRAKQGGPDIDQTYVALTERRTEEAKRLRRLGVVKDTRNLKKLEPREDGIANTVTTGDVKNSSLTNGSQIRRLTPTECERLQGFPDNWTQYGADGELISDTQRYKMCGNAVTTNVITWIANQLI